MIGTPVAWKTASSTSALLTLGSALEEGPADGDAVASARWQEDCGLMVIGGWRSASPASRALAAAFSGLRTAGLSPTASRSAPWSTFPEPGVGTGGGGM